ncbi:MAG: tRNA (adenosine(37)-N6)-threonylcarbamoyltransferase complex transferase subunit TsaD [Candidatus Nealsonbacteria bacterium]|nr:tRNA (adenosine(37)-N6)-threonylcarbamoyltransferase complex transferase subunit TsaD [Candidatus Nealsonbacteria bacterium]
MKILAIETSCDDTCSAVIEVKQNKEFRILSNTVSSQVKLHAKYGGVFPSLAKREHQKNLPIIVKKALKEAKNPKINLIAVTSGPGLEPCLWTGINFSKDLAKKTELPIVPVNHIEAHILANVIDKKPVFPAVCLIVSGGHTQIILMKKIGKYKILGETRDDAAGECFDKTARILELGYPGGPIISEKAAESKNKKLQIILPRPMLHQKNYDFSFSGLKTAVLYDFKKRSKKERKSKQYIQEMSAEIQQTIIDVLIKKTLKTAKDYRVKSIILSGGVAANKELRKQFLTAINNQHSKIILSLPDEKLCTDNAAMVAVAGYFNWQKKKNWKEIEANANLRISDEL